MSRKRFLAIVDPWANPQPHDADKFPHLQSDISSQCQIISNQLPRLKPLFDDIIVITSYSKTNPIFDELPSIDSILDGYLSDKQDWDMWLCGFHYGRCIHFKINEVIKRYGWDSNRFYIIQNLSWLFPGDIKNRPMNCILSERFDTRIQVFAYRDKEDPSEDAILTTNEYYWDYLGSLSEL
jgi:hypothetical protein